jgi:hypothetical protein
MAKFNTNEAKPYVHPAKSPMGNTGVQTVSHEGGKAWVHDDKSALVLLAVTNMVGEATFYEDANTRDQRYRELVRKVAVADGSWTLDFVTWLRDKANMRSASIVAACEAVHARLALYEEPLPGVPQENDGLNRRIIKAACVRADEQGELLAYWTSRFGRRIPKPVKRGVADAVQELYTGKNFLKWDSDSGYRFADVLELTHPSPARDKSYQGELFRYIIDKRHNRPDARLPEGNKTLMARQALMAMPVPERRKLVRSKDASQRLIEAGMTWEALAGWLQGPMDKAAWEAIIPAMGAFALMRNLRNFDVAGVSDDVAKAVCERLSDPEDIRKARVFPYRLLSAYRAAPSLRWGHALDKGLDAACSALPKLDGRSLVLVDTSGSMQGRVSSKSQVTHEDVGALIGVALAMRGNEVDLIGFADGQFPHNINKAGSALRQIEAFKAKNGSVGHGTRTVEALRATYRETIHKRVIIVSDMQAWSYGRQSVSETLPPDVPMFGINTNGYEKATINTSAPNRYEIGGFSDAMFKMMDLLSRGHDAGWPWEL